MIKKDAPDSSNSPGQAPEIVVDAVCARCGNVNPEGTMLCTSCGNNLRDQRKRRMAEALRPGASGFSGKKIQFHRWVAIVLGVFGVLIILWTALNLDQIEALLVILQSPAASDGAQFWNGPGSEVYAQLHTDLEAQPITDEEGNQALAETHTSDTYDGRYILMQILPFDQQKRVGEACVRRDNDHLFFVANLASGEEIRGEAWFENPDRLVVQETAAVKIEDVYYPIYGFAVRRNLGAFECNGQSYNNDSYYRAMAYRVPLPGEFRVTPTESSGSL